MKAFPTSESGRYPENIQGGMDLRDYFAAAALQGMISTNDYSIEKSVELAWHYADQMMEKRQPE